MTKAYNWLLEAEPWVRYNARVWLFDEDVDSAGVKTARSLILKHPAIISLLEELESWPGTALRNHKDSGHLLHKLAFLADIGLNVSDKKIHFIAQKILADKSEEGPFNIMLNIPKRFGGTGEDEMAWIACDAPLLLYFLIKTGFRDAPGVTSAIEYLLGQVRENGWGCFSAKAFEKFRGPGRKNDPCPYANLLMLRLISQTPDYHQHPATRAGIESFIELWKLQKERKPYLFGIGSDFRKLKAPLIWFDILNTMDTLTLFSDLKEHPVVQNLKKILEEKAAWDGSFRPESVYRAWKGWYFGQKKNKSAWISFLVYRIFKRLDC